MRQNSSLLQNLHNSFFFCTFAPAFVKTDFYRVAKDVQILWRECQTFLRDNLTATAYQTWFAPIVPVSYDGSVLVLLVKSQFIVEYIEENYLSLLSKVLRRVFGDSMKLEYRVQIGSEERGSMNLPSEADKVSSTPHPIVGEPTLREDDSFDSQLNAHWTFDTFVEGEPNRVAYAAAKSIAKQPGHTIFNPLFIFGGTGVGKSHLANAIGNEIIARQPGKRVLYVSAHTFQLQYQSAVVNNQTKDFLLFYQSLDVLIVDDIQYFANKKGTQDTFFHIFNYLQQSGRQLVLTADRPQVELHDLEERLLSRFKWGVSTEMLQPDFNLRRDILRSKMHHDGIKLPATIVDYIAANVTDNVRNLEGVLVSLLANSTLVDREIDMALTQQVVGRIVKIKPQEVSLEQISDMLCAQTGLPQNTLLKQNTRQRDVTAARQIGMYLAKKHTQLTLTDIGHYFGDRTHATVLHAIQQVEKQLNTNAAYAKQFDELESALIAH